jgi:hypothetical protein
VKEIRLMQPNIACNAVSLSAIISYRNHKSSELCRLYLNDECLLKITLAENNKKANRFIVDSEPSGDLVNLGLAIRNKIS